MMENNSAFSHKDVIPLLIIKGCTNIYIFSRLKYSGFEFCSTFMQMLFFCMMPEIPRNFWILGYADLHISVTFLILPEYLAGKTFCSTFRLIGV